MAAPTLATQEQPKTSNTLQSQGAGVSAAQQPDTAKPTGMATQNAGQGGLVSQAQPQASSQMTPMSMPTDKTQPQYGTTALSEAQTPAPGLVERGLEGAVTPEQTVQGQLTQLLDKGSPLIEQAERRGTRAAASRGIMDSSVGLQAGQSAAYQAALPIAQQDAGTFATQALTNQQNRFQNLLNQSTTAAQMYNQYSTNITEILNNPKLNTEQKNAAIENLQSVMQGGLGLMEGLSTLDLQSGLPNRGGTDGTGAGQEPGETGGGIIQPITDKTDTIADLRQQISQVQANPYMTPEQKASAIADLEARLANL